MPALSRTTSSEPFPSLQAHRLSVSQDGYTPNTDAPSSQRPPNRRRRTSSNLPGDLRGDTGAAALSTISDQKHEGHSITRSASERNAKPFARGYKRRKAKTLLRRWRSLSMRHTWLTPLILVLILLSAYGVSPGPHNPLHRAIFLSYPISNTFPVEYGKGGNDFAFVAFYTVVLSFTREFLMQRVIRPFALHCGIRSRAKQSRFMEQAYTAMYFAIFGPYGLYVMSRSPVWYFNTTAMFEGFPHRQHEGVFKAYYLLQAAYWSQQAMVLLLQLEKPRKDFKELVGHHVITVALIWLSYRFHFGYMGVAVYITHDISDFFLATSKVLNYLDHPLTTTWFVVFVFVWAYARHYINLLLLYSVLTEFKTVGPFELNWETQQYKCWISQIITFALLACLQAVNLFWFFLILRIAKRIVFDSIVADERSEDGTEVEEEQGSTREKREALGINTDGDAKAGINGSTIRGGAGAADVGETPTVMLNGMVIDDNAAYSTSAGPKTAVMASGRKSVEIKAQERRKR